MQGISVYNIYLYYILFFFKAASVQGLSPSRDNSQYIIDGACDGQGYIFLERRSSRVNVVKVEGWRVPGMVSEQV